MKFLFASVLVVLALFVSIELVVANQPEDSLIQLLQGVEANQPETSADSALVDARFNWNWKKMVGTVADVAKAIVNKRNAQIPLVEEIYTDADDIKDNLIEQLPGVAANQLEPSPNAPSLVDARISWGGVGKGALDMVKSILNKRNSQIPSLEANQPESDPNESTQVEARGLIKMLMKMLI